MRTMANENTAPKKILAVDDEKVNLRVVAGFVQSFGHECLTALSGPEAIELLDDSIDLVLLDIMMPDMDGYEVCRFIRESSSQPEAPIIMVTALNSREDRIKAVEAGASDFVSKPIDKTELRVRMNSLLKMKEARDEVKRYQNELEEMAQVRTRALQVAVDNLVGLQQSTVAAHLETIYCLASAAEYKDEETAEHIKRMSYTAAIVARAKGLPEDEVRMVLHSSPMHDVGKIGIPDSVLLKPGTLDPDEWAIMKRHTTIGAAILSAGSSEYLETGRTIALSHHEKWDGTGYPKGLAGEDIPLYGRICALADVFDALLSKRPYKDPFPMEKALDIMRQGRGTHFDPELLDLFMDNLDEILSIHEEFGEKDVSGG